MTRAWAMEPGPYVVEAGRSCEDLQLSATLHLVDA
jgi:hypothetical protein